MSKKGGAKRPSAWQSAALKHMDALYGFAMILTHSKTESEDLVQETYMNAMQHFERLRPDSNLKAWLFTILRNAWLKKLRHGRSSPSFVHFDENDVNHQPVVKNDPQSVFFRIWERDEVRSALKKLPRHFAEIVVLRELEEFSYKELAKMLDCPVGTVMSRLARARARFKQELSAQGVASADLLMDKR